jgi:hypothetical protein
VFGAKSPPLVAPCRSGIGMVLLFVPNGQNIAIAYWIFFIIAHLILPSTASNSTNSLAIHSRPGAALEKVFVGRFPYSLILIVGGIFVVVIMLDQLIDSLP